MMPPISSSGIWHAAADAAQTAAAWIPVIAVITAAILRLLMEWQLHRTLTRVGQDARGDDPLLGGACDTEQSLRLRVPDWLPILTGLERRAGTILQRAC